MTRCFVSAVMLALIGARVAAAEEDLAGQLKTLQKERVKVLAELVEIRAMQYKVATHPCEFVAGAEADLAKAQLDATDNREGRIAVLEEAAKRQIELLRTVEGKLKAGAVADAAVYCARAIYNDTKVRLLRERGPNADAVAQINAAQHERVEALTQLVKLALDQYEKGTTEVDAVVSAETALINAQVNAADTSEAKILVLTNAAKKETDFLKITEAKCEAGDAGSAEIDRARSLLLDAKIRLLRERTLQKAEVK